MIPNPWVILGAIFVAVSVYFYGHHRGWDERDAEMQAEIAIKNEESRTKEQELAKQLNEQSSKLLEANKIATKRQANLTQRLSDLLLKSPQTETGQSTNSTPASMPTKQ